MAVYKYKKHNVNFSLSSETVGSWSTSAVKSKEGFGYTNNNNNVILFRSSDGYYYNFDAVNVSDANMVIGTSYWTRTAFSGDLVSQTSKKVEIIKDGVSSWKWREYSRTKTFVKGVFIEDIDAEDGMYPANGQHSDGYWYVKDGLANRQPKVELKNEAGDVLMPLAEGVRYHSLGGIMVFSPLKIQTTDDDLSDLINIKYELNGTVIKTLESVTRDTDITLDLHNVDGVNHFKNLPLGNHQLKIIVEDVKEVV